MVSIKFLHGPAIVGLLTLISACGGGNKDPYKTGSEKNSRMSPMTDTSSMNTEGMDDSLHHSNDSTDMTPTQR